MINWDEVYANVNKDDRNFWDKLTDFFGFTTKQTDNMRAKAAAAAQQMIDSVDTTTDDVETLYNKGRSAAGVAANDKAGIAKKQAKAAASMGGASKLMSAIQGAQAANDAVQNGYDETASRAAGMEQANQQQKIANELSKASQNASNLVNTVNAQANDINTTRQNRLNRMGQAASAMASSFFGEK